ncbi:MAG TPA: NAD-dependent epimerase/dehydratase family protein, partial [Candidatus Dormibacteraeota bacterium]
MILVTGATGFVGSHLLRRLARSDNPPVRGLVRRGRTGVRDGVDPVVGDLTKPETIGPALAGVSTVVHAAAITGDKKEPYRGAYDQINRVGTENLVAAAREAGVGRFVLLSGLGTAPAPAGT